MLNSIRPKVILEMLEHKFPDENIPMNVLMPSSAIGSLRLIESALLVALTKLTDAQRIFEFGTFMGATSVLLASNSSDKTRVYTIDISPEELEGLKTDTSTKAEEVDDYLRDMRVNLEAKCIVNSSDEVKNKISEILMNSHHFEPEKFELNQQCQLIFVDGGHDTETISKDTINALKMRSEEGAIIWHDYNSPVFNEVTEYLNAHEMKEHIVFIEDTQMAIYWPTLNNALKS